MVNQKFQKLLRYLKNEFPRAPCVRSILSFSSGGRGPFRPGGATAAALRPPPPGCRGALGGAPGAAARSDKTRLAVSSLGADAGSPVRVGIDLGIKTPRLH